jgi:TPR repeat protein
MRAWLLVLVACGKDSAPAPSRAPIVETCTPGTIDAAKIEDCEAHCRAGSVVACATAAHKYCSGIGVKKDVDKCLAVALHGCELGGASACDHAALVYTGSQDNTTRHDNHELKERYSQRTEELQQRDCDAGDGEACIHLAFYAEYDHDQKRAASLQARGKELEQQACDRGNGYACHLLAIQCANPTPVVDVARSRALDHRACELDHAESCELEALGKLGPESEALLKKACELGLPSSCGFLADDLRRSGEDQAASGYEKRACELRNRRLCQALGTKLASSDPAGAAAAFRAACELGDDDSCKLSSTSPARAP